MAASDRMATSSSVTNDVCFLGTAQPTSTADMRRKAAVRVGWKHRVLSQAAALTVGHTHLTLVHQ